MHLELAKIMRWSEQHSYRHSAPTTIFQPLFCPPKDCSTGLMALFRGVLGAVKVASMSARSRRDVQKLLDQTGRYANRLRSEAVKRSPSIIATAVGTLLQYLHVLLGESRARLVNPLVARQPPTRRTTATAIVDWALYGPWLSCSTRRQGIRPTSNASRPDDVHSSILQYWLVLRHGRPGSTSTTRLRGDRTTTSQNTWITRANAPTGGTTVHGSHALPFSTENCFFIGWQVC